MQIGLWEKFKAKEIKKEPETVIRGGQEWTVISKYTRAQCLKDGYIIDVSELAKEAGFVYPMAITLSLYDELDPTELEADTGQSFTGRMWDVLNILRWRIRKEKDTNCIHTFIIIQVETVASPKHMQQKHLHFKSTLGPGDDAEPVLTIDFNRYSMVE